MATASPESTLVPLVLYKRFIELSISSGKLNNQIRAGYFGNFTVKIIYGSVF